MRRMKTAFLAVAMVMSLPIMSWAIAIHATFVDQNCEGITHDGQSWKTAFLTVADGLKGADADHPVWVAKGHYNECITLRAGIKLYGGFIGKELFIDLRDPRANETILDGQSGGTVVTAPAGADTETMIDGFTITGGNVGICCDGGSATISNNVIHNCSATTNGGGIYCHNSAPVITHNLIMDNSATIGGGILCDVAGATITDNAILSNDTNGSGGGIFATHCAPIITNNVIADNTANVTLGTSGGGVYCEYDTGAVIANNLVVRNVAAGGGGIYLWRTNASCFVRGNTIAENSAGGLGLGGGLDMWQCNGSTAANNIIAFNICNGCRVSGDYSWHDNCVYGNTPWDYWGFSGDPSDINSDPLFVDRTAGNYHILPSSPCIDVGDDSVVGVGETDFDGEARIQGTHVDMGVDECAGATVQQNVITSTGSIVIQENGVNAFSVKLNAPPDNLLTVSVTADSGSPDITVQSGSALTFTIANWDTYQNVTLAAAADADAVVDETSILCHADNWSDATVSASTQEAQGTLTVQSIPVTGVTITGTPSGVTNYDSAVTWNTSVSITAPAWAGDHYFVHWLNAFGVPVGTNPTLSFTFAADTTVTAEYSTSGYSTDYYVNDDTPEGAFAAGNDTNSGLTPAAPMRHIQALLNLYPYIGAGSTLHISDGGYGEHITISSAHSGLTVQGAGSDLVVIYGLSTGHCLEINGATDLHISGILFAAGSQAVGGGIYCHDGASVWISDCKVIESHADTYGGGIECTDSTLDIRRSEITGNNAGGEGGGIDFYNSHVTITNCVLDGNSAVSSGGGISASASTVALVNITFEANKTLVAGGALFISQGSQFTLRNCILWNSIQSFGTTVMGITGGGVHISYCDIQGGPSSIFILPDGTLTWGTGNIDSDPLFVNPGYWLSDTTWLPGEYHERSTGGRWIPGGWVNDAQDSPVIDAGDPADDCSNELLPNGGRVNIGAYGNTDQASKTFSYLLTVRSTPITAVAITGTPSGTTQYTSWRAPSSSVTLTAPTPVTSGGKIYYFSKWTVGGIAQPTGVTTCSFSMTADKTATASYKSVTSLKITGPTTVKEMTTVKYVCTATYSDGSSYKCTSAAKWKDNSAYAKFIAPGKLKLSSVRANCRCRITASYSGKSKSLYITIKNVR